MKLRGEKPPRPLTHDLFCDAIEKLGAELIHVLIIKIEEGTFFANLYLKTEKGEAILDCRPSDGIVLCTTGTKAPIFCEEKVLEEMGYLPDENGNLIPIRESQSSTIRPVTEKELKQLREGPFGSFIENLKNLDSL